MENTRENYPSEMEQTYQSGKSQVEEENSDTTALIAERHRIIGRISQINDQLESLHQQRNRLISERATLQNRKLEVEVALFPPDCIKKTSTSTRPKLTQQDYEFLASLTPTQLKEAMQWMGLQKKED